MIQNNKTLITEIEWCKKPVISDLFPTDTFNKDAMVLRNGLFLYYLFFNVWHSWVNDQLLCKVRLEDIVLILFSSFQTRGVH